MNTALYHQDGRQPQRLTVLKKNEDGTLDLGMNGKAIITSCPVSESPKAGHATIGEDPQKAEEASEVAKLKADHLKALLEQENAFAKELADLKAAHAEEVAKLKGVISSAQNAIKKLEAEAKK